MVRQLGLVQMRVEVEREAMSPVDDTTGVVGEIGGHEDDDEDKEEARC